MTSGQGHARAAPEPVTGVPGALGVDELRWMAAIVDGSDDTIITTSLDAVVLSWNPAAERLYGYRAEEILGRSIKIIEPPELAGDVERVIGQVVEGHSVVRCETVRMAKGGRRIDMALTLSPVRDGEGRLVAVSAIGHDISEQRRIWRRHADERAYNRGLIEASLDGLLTVGPDLRLRDVNRAVEALTGQARAELIGTPFAVLFTDPVAAEGAVRRVFADGRVCDVELVIRHRDGHRTPVSCNATIYHDAAGEPQGAFVAARDVELRRRAEEEVLRLNAELEDRVRTRTAQLQQSNRDLESFAYSVAHDLRTPLRAMTGFSELLLEEYGPRLGDEGRHYADRIRDAGQSMASLIDDLLQLSRVSMARPRKQPVDLSRLVREIAAELRTREPERSATFHIEAGVTAPADPALIRDMLRQLLDNAWKFTTPRAHAEISFASVPSDQGELCCVIEDNGAGFDPDHGDRLFLPFQRLHGVREFPGTGVGLAGVRRIIEHHGGRTWAEGKVGHGARFYFTLPLRDRPWLYRRPWIAFTGDGDRAVPARGGPVTGGSAADPVADPAEAAGRDLGRERVAGRRRADGG